MYCRERSRAKPLQWQAHVYGTAREGLGDACRNLGLSLHTLPWSDAAARAGLAKDALYLVRPDGYVAMADGEADPGRVESYLKNLVAGES